MGQPPRQSQFLLRQFLLPARRLSLYTVGMLALPVSAAKLLDLAQRMQRLGLRESDLQEDFIQGSGAGGQKINKTSSVVLLTHALSGLQVRAQAGRSQALNRYYARKLLVEKLEEKILGEASRKRQAIEKVRRQKRRRSRRAKEKMLENKRHHAVKKTQRRSPRAEE